MDHLSFRQFFKPAQPSVKSAEGDIQYEEVVPEVMLENDIYCYWRLKSGNKLSSPFTYRVIPDGCVDIFFDMRNLQDSRIMGFTSRPIEFELDSSFDFVGVRFLPGSFPCIFRMDVSELTERNENLSDVVPSLAMHLAHTLTSTHTLQEVKRAFDRYFLNVLEKGNIVVDKRLRNAIFLVLKNHGDLNLSSDIDTGISPRQLRRLFEFYVGDTPKVFSKIVRFQYFFQLLSSHNGAPYNHIFLDAGYYDQPHFNNEFRSLFGLTPTQALTF